MQENVEFMHEVRV